MNRRQRRQLILDIAREMGIRRSTTTHKVESKDEVVIDIDGHVILTLTVGVDVQAKFELHPKVAQRGVEADKALVENAQRFLDAVLLGLFKEEILLREAQ